MGGGSNFRKALGLVGLILVLAYAVTIGFGGTLYFDHAAQAQQSGTVPGQSLGGASDAEIWRALRQGESGMVSIPDKKSGVLIQSEGENWRAIRNGPLSTYGVWGMLGMIILLALFFVVRGRIRIEAGPSDARIERFNGLERFTHWLMATSFIILAVTGLNMLYGRYFLPDVLGPEAFSLITLWGKIGHNYLAFAFMLGVIMAFFLWIGHNLPSRHDIVWLLKAGGMFTKGTHPPARKFNAGQKVIFWIVILGGISISLSGITLLFPFETHFFEHTFRFLASIGIDGLFGYPFPVEVTPLQEQQLAQLWHGAVGLILIIVIIAHIYIGTLGMEGAFDAMGSGQVDENWAREHHSLWVAEKKGESAASHGHAAE